MARWLPGDGTGRSSEEQLSFQARKHGPTHGRVLPPAGFSCIHCYAYTQSLTGNAYFIVNTASLSVMGLTTEVSTDDVRYDPLWPHPLRSGGRRPFPTVCTPVGHSSVLIGRRSCQSHWPTNDEARGKIKSHTISLKVSDVRIHESKCCVVECTA